LPYRHIPYEAIATWTLFDRISFFTTDAVAILRWSKECDRVRVATDKIYATKMNYDAPVSAARLFNE